MKTFSALLCALAFAAHSAIAATGWTDDYEKALAQAKTEKKHVLLNFTGSDWCGWCIKLDKNVFSRPDFEAFAKENLVPVTVDFPQRKKLEKRVAEQNEKLKEEHGVSGFPTIVLLSPEGKVVQKWPGYSAVLLPELKAKVTAAKGK